MMAIVSFNESSIAEHASRGVAGDPRYVKATNEGSRTIVTLIPILKAERCFGVIGVIVLIAVDNQCTGECSPEYK